MSDQYKTAIENIDFDGDLDYMSRAKQIKEEYEDMSDNSNSNKVSERKIDTFLMDAIEHITNRNICKTKSCHLRYLLHKHFGVKITHE